MAIEEGFEPSTLGSVDRCSFQLSYPTIILEVPPRIELGSQGFADPRLTIHPKEHGSGRWARTTDTQIQSLMFYRLNYSGMATSTGLEPVTFGS